MSRQKKYDWNGFVQVDNIVDVSELRNFDKCVSVLCKNWHMEKSIAESEIKLVLSDYINYFNVFNNSETNLTLEKLSALHKFIKGVESNELYDIQIFFKGKKKNVFKTKKTKEGESISIPEEEKIEISSGGVLQNILSLLKTGLIDPKRPVKPKGRKKGHKTETLAQSILVLKLDDRFKSIVQGKKDRFTLIGILLIAINVFTDIYFDKNYIVIMRDRLIDKVEVLFRI